MPAIVTERMVDAAYKWACDQSSMVGWASEDQVKTALKDIFTLMYETGYPGMTPVRIPTVQAPAAPPKTDS